MKIVYAFVGLGSNLGDRETALSQAIELLGAGPEVGVVAVSSFRETEPVGYLDQPRFLNAAAKVETDLGPRALLERLLAVEQALGRRRDGPRYGPRTIDLDLLVYGEETVDEPGLRIPHPRLHERRFVLEPLVELDSELRVPGLGAVSEILARLD